MDYIFVNALLVKARIGIYEWEQQIEQTLSIDFEIGIDAKKIAQTDDIESSINYFSVAETIKSLFAERNFRLVETAAQTVADIIMKEYPVQCLKIRLGKPNALPDAALVGVVIERKRES